MGLVGTEVGRIAAHGDLAGFPVDAGFLDTLAAPLDAAADLCERQLDEFAHRTGLACRQHEIVGRISLQYPVHALDIIPGVAPVASCPEISAIEGVFQSRLHAGASAPD